MKTLLILISFLFTYSAQPLARGETNIGNGMGASEANIIYAYHNLETELSEFLFTSSDTLMPNEEVILKKWINSARQEKGTKLLFVPENDFPGTSGRYYTTTQVGSTVYFNLDQLFEYDQMGVKRPLSIGQAILLSIDINRRNNPTPIDMTSLKNKILLSYLESTSQLLLHDREELRLILRKTKDNKATAKVFLTDFNGLLDITPKLISELYCPSQYQIRDFRITNLYAFTSHFPNRHSQNAKFNGTVDYQCFSQHGSLRLTGDITIFSTYLFNPIDDSIFNDNDWLSRNHLIFLDKENINIIISNIHRS